MGPEIAQYVLSHVLAVERKHAECRALQQQARGTRRRRGIGRYAR